MKCQILFIEHLLVELRSLSTARAVLALEGTAEDSMREREDQLTTLLDSKNTRVGGGIHLRNTSQISKTIKSEEIIIAFLKIFVFRFSLHIQILQNHTVTPAWCTKTLSHNCRPICCEETLHSWAPCEQAKRCYDIFLFYKKSVSRQ